MGPEILVFAILIALTALGAAIVRARARRGRSATATGRITAAVIRLQTGARLRGTGEALSVGPVITTGDGERLQGRFVRAPDLPLPVRRQLFTNPHIINEYAPALALGSPAAQSAAREQARGGGFTMQLDEPVAVDYEQLRDGTIEWRMP